MGCGEDIIYSDLIRCNLSGVLACTVQKPMNRTDWPLDEIAYYLAVSYQLFSKSR